MQSVRPKKDLKAQCFSNTELLLLRLERHLNIKQAKSNYPAEAVLKLEESVRAEKEQRTIEPSL